ncbi:hypothetical protein AB0N24_09835 [Arthrobacter sp. NPDC093128]|uniref:hypothetical protein n=1 Tax=Arthrobacter sp. NPDC093128 TaxID=3154979 RepID=UPI0034344F10
MARTIGSAHVITWGKTFDSGDGIAAGLLGRRDNRKSVRALDKGSYTVTAACIGIPNAVLHISQSNLRGGTTHELALDCGTTATTTLELEDGPVLAQGIRMTPEPGAGSVVGFWIVPAT